MTKRIFIGALVVLALILVMTFDSVWSQQHPVQLTRWFLGALLLAISVFVWCVIQLFKMLRNRENLRTMDSFFWIVFFILPTSLGAVVWLLMSINYVAESYG